MRRLVVLVVAVALATAACNRRRSQVETIEEPGSTLAMVVHVADPAASAQLLRGFYDVEQNSWRWTAGRFAVSLRPPAAAAEKGATLVLRFSMPDPVVQRLGSVSISASVNGTALPPETYSKTGEQVYRREVPAAAFAGPAATVDFSLDKSLPAGSLDQRELGIVVTSIGFESK